jgi:hypothetical protein
VSQINGKAHFHQLRGPRYEQYQASKGLNRTESCDYCQHQLASNHRKDTIEACTLNMHPPCIVLCFCGRGRDRGCTALRCCPAADGAELATGQSELGLIGQMRRSGESTLCNPLALLCNSTHTHRQRSCQVERGELDGEWR